MRRTIAGRDVINAQLHATADGTVVECVGLAPALTRQK